MVGNPARIARHRFDPETIIKLLEIAWWNCPEDEIQALPNMMSDDIESFISYFRENGKYSYFD